MLSFVCEPRSLVYSPIHIITAFDRVIPHFSVAKLVCSRARPMVLTNGVTVQIFLYQASGLGEPQNKEYLYVILGASLYCTYFLCTVKLIY